MNILGLLDSLVMEFSENKKTSKLIRSSPERFSRIPIVYRLLESSKMIEQDILAKPDRKKNLHDLLYTNRKKS